MEMFILKYKPFPSVFYDCKIFNFKFEVACAHWSDFP